MIMLSLALYFLKGEITQYAISCPSFSIIRKPSGNRLRRSRKISGVYGFSKERFSITQTETMSATVQSRISFEKIKWYLSLIDFMLFSFFHSLAKFLFTSTKGQIPTPQLRPDSWRTEFEYWFFDSFPRRSKRSHFLKNQHQEEIISISRTKSPVKGMCFGNRSFLQYFIRDWTNFFYEKVFAEVRRFQRVSFLIFLFLLDSYFLHNLL